ncbi:MAG TPA: zinc-dependent metalloprotease [Actinomycetota bacterium]|nr:zinc-dependent metalloprotease [Actinomycetota bacterium]
MNIAADTLADWTVARQVADRVAGTGPALGPVDRARLREDFAEVVPEAEKLAADAIRLPPSGHPSRPWVMSRNEWLDRNLRSFEVVLAPIADQISSGGDGGGTALRRKVLGTELGALVGYLSRRVLGQFDLFVPPDDEGTIYFVGPNIAGIERQHQFPERDFRLWIALHEVAHRLQFGSVPWLRGYVSGLVDGYLRSINLDVRYLIDLARHAAEEVRAGRAEWRGMGWVTLLMTPEQRRTFAHAQAVMTLLEGHGNFTMNEVSRGRIRGAERFRRTLRARRQSRPVERAFQRAIGFDQKAKQYDAGEGFVTQVVQRVGIDGFNLVWERPENLPTLEELGRPDEWLARVARR